MVEKLIYFRDVIIKRYFYLSMGAHIYFYGISVDFSTYAAKVYTDAIREINATITTIISENPLICTNK